MPAGPEPNERLIVAIARERAHGRYMHHIAAEIGVHPSLLSRWMYGHRELPAHHARALAAALRCKLEDIT